MDANGLTLKYSGYSHDYDHKKNPTALNEFATAAFRVGHSLIYVSLRQSLIFLEKEFQNIIGTPGRIDNLNTVYYEDVETKHPRKKKCPVLLFYRASSNTTVESMEVADWDG